MRNDFILWQKKKQKKISSNKTILFCLRELYIYKKKKTKQNGYWMEHVRAVRSEKTQVCEEAKSWKRFQERQRDKFVFFVDAEKTPRQITWSARVPLHVHRIYVRGVSPLKWCQFSEWLESGSHTRGRPCWYWYCILNGNSVNFFFV
jgi:hypothetical protein